MRPTVLIMALLALISNSPTQSSEKTTLKYAPAAVDNPLKGLVPYAGDKRELFPHSMEFNYVPLGRLVVAEGQYDWQPMEKLLNDIAGRGHQAVIRVWIEYPGRDEGMPRFLEDQGVKVTEWMNTNTAPFPHQKVRTPDYDDPRLRKTLVAFIEEFGKRYDGDPRLGFITAGLLGTWGEWHTYPRTDLMPGKAVQMEVMDAYEKHFHKTPVLLRYPAGEDNYDYAANHLRSLGYHDDSFAWATLDTGREEDNWFFVPAMKSAGSAAADKWKTQPIGGEVRPELWGQIFDEKPAHPKAQDFRKCVVETHASWLLDTGMFQKKQSAERVANASRQVQQMGYEFHVAEASLAEAEDGFTVMLNVKNTGVAPFYHPWVWEIGAVDSDGKVIASFPSTQTLLQIMPNANRELKFEVSSADWPAAATGVAVRVVNPMKGGRPLRFANEESVLLADGWLKVGACP